MITKNKPKRSDTLSIHEFLSQHNLNPLVIPNEYQREYAWSKKKGKNLSAFEVFLKDFYEAYVEESYFTLGNNVCVAHNDDITKHIADGQQRLTSVFILGLYLARMLGKESRIAEIFYLNTRPDELILQHSIEAWNDVFRNTILANDDELIPVFAAQKQIADFIKSVDNFDAEKWLVCLLQNVHINVHQIALEDGPAYFADVNTKGVVLNEVDLFKSEFIHKLGVELGDIKKATESWQEVMKKMNTFGNVYVNTGSDSVTETIIKWTLFILGLTPTPACSKLRSTCLKIQSYSKFIDYMSRISELAYRIYLDPDFSMLKYINNGNFIPAFIKLSIKKFNKQEVINYLLYMLIVHDLNSQTKNNRFYEIIDKSDLTIEYNSGLFKEDFLIYKGGANKKIKAVLALLENHFNPKFTSDSNWHKACTIEHISSQQFCLENCNCIGNLTLLTKSENSKLNKLQEKYPIYRDSSFNITRNLCIDYTPSNDKLRMFRSNTYGKGYRSQDIDAFTNTDIEDRSEKLYDSLIKTLNLKVG